MLSGISRKRSIRSRPYWFTEFCNSQCLSHFAAPFIVVRAETSIAESCICFSKRVRRRGKREAGVNPPSLPQRSPPTNLQRMKCGLEYPSRGTKKEDGPILPQLPSRVCTRESMLSPSLHRLSHQVVHMKRLWITCE